MHRGLLVSRDMAGLAWQQLKHEQETRLWIRKTIVALKCHGGHKASESVSFC